jgi:hypothetical protein
MDFARGQKWAGDIIHAEEIAFWFPVIHRSWVNL